MNVLLEGFNALVASCHEASMKAGWWTEQVTGRRLDLIICYPITHEDHTLAGALVGQKLMLIESEIAEGMEGHRTGAQDKHLPHRKSLEVELADAVIRIADLAGALNLDLGGAIVEKLAFNATRADHKPEARAAAGGKAY